MELKNAIFHKRARRRPIYLLSENLVAILWMFIPLKLAQAVHPTLKFCLQQTRNAHLPDAHIHVTIKFTALYHRK